MNSFKRPSRLVINDFLLSLMMPNVIINSKSICEIIFFCGTDSYLSRASEDPNFGYMNLNSNKIFLWSLAEKC